ncbi:MAG: FkbM family methyltransferase [Pseudomonadota bacterium]
MNINEALVRIVRQSSPRLVFNILEIGARPIDGQPEPFHSLIPMFPGTRINAFEVDPGLCETLNNQAPNGLVYHPVALGQKEEERPFYMTRHPMCASLYKSNERLIERYNNMDVAMLKDVSTIRTVSLDHFVAVNDLPAIDFIKIDIQGAELDVFQGGASTLKNVLAIVTEVEFFPLYENQPLFGDVHAFLAKSGFAFHKFMSLSGRSLKPVVFNNNTNFATQHMWADAMFLRDPAQPDIMSPDQLLKLAILAAMYGSPDVSVYCLQEYDRRRATATSRELMSYFHGGQAGA